MYFCPMSIVKAKKSLGQHFLKDQNIARKIIDSLLPVTAEVLEIGPGMGVLTRHLLEQGIFAVKAIDIDQESIAYLHNEFPSYHDRIIFGDFLKTDLSAWYSAPFSVIGNLPYNISSQIFFRIIENHLSFRVNTVRPYSDDITFWHLSPYLHIVIAPFHICPLHLVIPRDKALPFGFVDLLILSRLLFKPATEVNKLRNCHKLRKFFHTLCTHKRLAEIAEP